AGDEMQGTPVSNFNFGRPAIAALNALGIDATAIGNHEFDWTVDTLRARMAEAHYRFLAANITDSAGTARPDWAEPFTVIARDGVRVAVIGLAFPAHPQPPSPRNVRGRAFGRGRDRGGGLRARERGGGYAARGAGAHRDAVRGPHPPGPRPRGRATLEPGVRLGAHRPAGGPIRNGAAADGRRTWPRPAH